MIYSDNTTVIPLNNNVKNHTSEIQQQSSNPLNSTNEQLNNVNSILHKSHSPRIINGGGVIDYLPGINKDHMGFNHK